MSGAVEEGIIVAQAPDAGERVGRDDPVVLYVGALTAYATGSRDGVRLWLEHVCAALVAAAADGRAVADAVLAGRLPSA